MSSARPAQPRTAKTNKNGKPKYKIRHGVGSAHWLVICFAAPPVLPDNLPAPPVRLPQPPLPPTKGHEAAAPTKYRNCNAHRRSPGDLTSHCCDGVVTFLNRKAGTPRTPSSWLRRKLRQFLRAVAHEDQRVDAPCLSFANKITIFSRSGCPPRRTGRGAPARRTSIPKGWTCIRRSRGRTQAGLLARQTVGGLEHLRLQMARLIPGRLTARRRNREQQPSTSARGFNRRGCRDLCEERGYLVGVCLARQI